jgi:integrating conjugative element protein (TIGR03756 family)
MFKKIFNFIGCALILISGWLSPVQAEFVPTALTTPFLIQSGLQALPACISYQVTGACFWLQCGLEGCSTHQTPKVKHYVPELLVFVYPDYDRMPWIEYKLLRAPLKKATEAAYTVGLGFPLSDGHLSGPNSSLQEVTLLEAVVAGHPILGVLPPYLLRGRGSPGLPYFDSLTDVLLWRGGETEMLPPPSYILSSKNTVGPELAPFGSVYPRTGFLLQSDFSKSAATIAVRALHVVSSFPTLHLASGLAPCAYSECRVAPIIDGASEKTRYQQILPFQDAYCTEHIHHHPLFLSAIQATEIFAWAVWREYEGCLPGVGQFIYSV